MLGDFLSCLAVKLQRTDDTFNIAGMDLLSRLRVCVSQHFIEFQSPLFVGSFLLQFSAVRLIPVIFRKVNVIEKRLNIKSRAPYDQRDLPF